MTPFLSFIVTVGTAFLGALVRITWKISRTMTSIEGRLETGQKWMDEREGDIKKIPVIEQRVKTLEERSN